VLGSPEWELRAAVAASGSELSRIVPRLSQRIPGLSMPPPLGAEEARFRLFDSITLFLQEVAGSRPLLLILDDLHWADQPSLLLFQFIARELREGRVLILGTYRDIEVAQGHPLAETLTVLRREKLFESIPIAGLSATEVTQLLEHFSLRELDSRDRNLAAALHEQTEGNALFLQEILRDLVQSGQISSTSGGNGHRLTSLRDLAIPEGVMDIISRRLSRLSADCNQALSVAAVIGRDFGLNVLQRLARLSEERLLEVMDEAVAVRVADEGSGGIGRYSFSHALIREALYGGLSSARRARAHAGIVEVLEEMSIDHPHAYLSELSFHSIHAGSLLDPNKAILYGKRAGDGAMEVFAYEEAMDHYRGAVEALRNITPVAEVRLSELLLSLGDASRRAGHIDSAKATFREVAELAKARGAAEQQARAALGYGAALPTVANTDEVLIGLLEEALGLLPDQDSPLRAMVLARLASELSWRKQPERQAALSIGALEMARRLGDTKAMNTAVSALRLAQWSPDNLDQRLESSTEMAALAAQSADREIEITARLWRMSDLFEAGEAEAADVEMNICIPLAQEFQHPFYLWRAEIMRAMRAVTRGHFQEALRIGTEARAAGDRSDPDTAAALYMTLVYGVYRELGRLAEVEAPWARLAVKVPAPVLAIGQGQVYLQGGKPDQALEVYQRFRGNDFQDIPRDVYWLTAIALVAELSVEFEDGDGQAIIADLLRPHAHQCIIVGTRASLWWGSIAHYLGQVLTPMGELDEADTAFQTASVVHERFGAAPLLARTNLEHARMLVARAGNGDREDAKRLLSEVVPVADELGMSLVLRDARELSASTV
jgi:tetratricopeptide (TPR) repeat protein